MRYKTGVFCIAALVLMYFCMSCSRDRHLAPVQKLGKKIFFDTNLSTPVGQSCSTCHQKKGGWAGPDSRINKETAVFPGAKAPRFGNRKPPTASYAGFSPSLHIDKEGNFVGGLFWDGRATGWETGDPLAEQAAVPFLNPLEHNLKNKEVVIRKIIDSDYADLFRKVWGRDSFSRGGREKVFMRIVQSIAAYERSRELNPFNSRFDDFWRNSVRAGIKVEKINEKNMILFRGMGLNERELNGLVAFNNKGKCSQCHVLTSVNTPPLFTDFTYDNLGVPRNPKNPFYRQGIIFNPKGEKWKDLGLGKFLLSVPRYRKYAKENMGKQKVPTLRNVDLRESDNFVKSFLHNGLFTSLKEVVDFYNTRDLPEKKWPEAEVKENVNTEELGNLGLTEREVDNIVLFMKTLSDR